MEKFITQNLDVTIGATVATISGWLMRSYGVTLGFELEAAIVLLLLAIAARVGLKLKKKPAVEPDVSEVPTLVLDRPPDEDDL